MNTGLLYLPQYNLLTEGAKTPLDGAKATQKLTIRERVVHALQHKADVPALPATVHRLMDVVKKPTVDIDTIAEVARLDPGITAKILQVASSPVFGGKMIHNLQDALLMIGLEEMKRIATTITVINTFRHLHVRVNWELFWLHSLLTARLTETLANAYRPVDGREYLAGLLHDVGKLFFEHNFPQEFEMVVMRAMTSREGMYEAESRLLDITHAEVSAMLANKWRLPHEVVGAIQFHHEPNSSLNRDPSDSGYTPFLSLCVCVANQIANQCHANMQGAENPDRTALEAIPEWGQLQELNPSRTLSLDVAGELQKAREIIRAVKAPPAEEPKPIAK